MLLDYENLYSDDQAITADAASTNVVDHGSTKDHGPGESPALLIQVTEAFDALTSLNVKFETATDAAFTTPVVLATQNLVLADLVVGAQLSISFPSSGLLRYTRCNYDVVGTNPSVGQLTAGLTPGLQRSFQ